MFRDKYEHDKYMRVMISNLGHDEASYNLTNKQAFSSRESIPGALLEKIDRLEMHLQELLYNIEHLQHMIDNNYDTTAQLIRLELIQTSYKTAIHDLVTGYGMAIENFERIAKGKM